MRELHPFSSLIDTRAIRDTLAPMYRKRYTGLDTVFVERDAEHSRVCRRLANRARLRELMAPGVDMRAAMSINPQLARVIR